MKNQEVPTIEEISGLFIPDHLKEHFKITEITPEKITVEELKKPSDQSKRFLEVFSFAAKMAGFKTCFE